MDEKHETLIAKVGVVVSRFLLFMLFRFFASPFLSASTLARVRVRTFVGLGRSSSSSSKHEYVFRASSLVLKLLLSFHPPPPFFFVSGDFLVWCFEGFACAASGVKAFPTLNCVMCASSVLLCFGLYCDGGILECAELGVCFFFFFGLL